MQNKKKGAVSHISEKMKGSIKSENSEAEGTLNSLSLRSVFCRNKGNWYPTIAMWNANSHLPEFTGFPGKLESYGFT